MGAGAGSVETFDPERTGQKQALAEVRPVLLEQKPTQTTLLGPEAESSSVVFLFQASLCVKSLCLIP